MRKDYFIKTHEKGVRCNLCPMVVLIEGCTGICRQRRNRGGILVAKFMAGYRQLPWIPWKKPLYHFYPGTDVLSIGSLWCNLRCEFCQNWHIAHKEQHTVYISPERLVERALNLGAIGIAYTYNEPIIWYEYVYDTVKLARDKGLKNVLITNGFINREPLEKLLPYIDAMNIDVKAFNNDFYRDICKGDLSPVKDTVKMSASACHIEITSLIIIGLMTPLEMSTWLSGYLRSTQQYPYIYQDTIQTISYLWSYTGGLC